MSSCSTDTFLSLSKDFAALTPAQLQLVHTVLLCRILRASNPMASCDPNDLLQEAQCFTCLTQHQLLSVQTQLLCEILNSGGSPGAVCLLCGLDDPVDAPSCDCAIYYRSDTGHFWFWDSIGAAWIKFIN